MQLISHNKKQGDVKNMNLINKIEFNTDSKLLEYNISHSISSTIMLISRWAGITVTSTKFQKLQIYIWSTCKKPKPSEEHFMASPDFAPDSW